RARSIPRSRISVLVGVHEPYLRRPIGGLGRDADSIVDLKREQVRKAPADTSDQVEFVRRPPFPSLDSDVQVPRRREAFVVFNRDLPQIRTLSLPIVFGSDLHDHSPPGNSTDPAAP